MSYKNLVVYLDPTGGNARVLQVTGDLAAIFHASVLGISARQPAQVVYMDGYVPSDLFERDHEDMRKAMATTEAEFRTALQPRVPKIEWRSNMLFGVVADYLAMESRTADLLLIGAGANDWLNDYRVINVGDLVMQAGRPVLVVPEGVDGLALECALIAWKDSREARRAIVAALPLLKHASKVDIVEIAAPDDTAAAHARLVEVVGWLRSHGVEAKMRVAPATGDDAQALFAIAHEQKADLVVAGAYGHSRLREWALGGVTRELLQRSKCCVLLVH